MARHRRDQQDAARLLGAVVDVEADQIPEIARDLDRVSTRWSRPSSATTVRMPQSGLIVMRAKARSVTRPQADMTLNIGCGTSPQIG
jgi:hypothetical protein